MRKKEIIVPFLVIGLTILFAGICVAVFLSNGKSKKWVARKMKIGGLLLTLTVASCNGGGGEVMCYDTVAPNSIWLHDYNDKGIEIKLDTNNVLIGSISELSGKEFSFAIKDSTDKKFQQGLLVPVDGEFNQSNEDFKIEIDKNLISGKYSLKLYASGIDGQDSTYAAHEVVLLVKDE